MITVWDSDDVKSDEYHSDEESCPFYIIQMHIEAAYGNLYQNTWNMHSYLAVQQDNLINWI